MIILLPKLQETATTLFKEEENTQEQGQNSIASVNKVQSQFDNSNGLGIYRSFLKTMCKYRKKKKSVAKVYDKMFVLFHGHVDLIQEFEGFFNDETKQVLKEIKKSQAFVMEDCMYKVDVLLSSMTSTIEQAKGILEGQIEYADEGLTLLQLRCFERLYTERGLEMMDKLRANPQVVLPVILPRLKKKEEELTRAR